jgi:hypothetical protein
MVYPSCGEKMKDGDILAAVRRQRMGFPKYGKKIKDGDVPDVARRQR